MPQHSRSRLAAHLAAAGVLLGLAGCVRAVPEVTYRTPNVALTPVGSPGVADGRRVFARAFCDAMTEVDGDMGSCRDHLDYIGMTADLPRLPIPSGVKVLVVSGIMSQCMEDGCRPEAILEDCLAGKCVAAYCQGLEHLRRRYGAETHYVSVPALGSSLENAKVIAAYLRDHPGRYVAVGYSKGAVDLLVMLQTYPSTQSSVSALVSIAGAIGGSRLADLLPIDAQRQLMAIVKETGLGACSVSDGGGFGSLRRESRHTFLRRLDLPPAIATFSLVGISSRARTSKALQLFWDRLAPYSVDQDSQVVAEEGIIPGSTYLGAVRADHWAIALPFSNLNDPKTDRRIDQNRFPRSALLQAVVAIAANWH